MSLQQLGWPLHLVQNVMRMSGRLEERNKKWSWFWRDAVISEWNWTCLFFSYTWPRRWGPSPRSGPTWSKANRWARIVSHLLGCQLPLARSENLLGGLKTPTNSYQLGIVFRSELARSLASKGGPKDDVARKHLTTHDITDEPPCRIVLNNSVKSNTTS